MGQGHVRDLVRIASIFADVVCNDGSDRRTNHRSRNNMLKGFARRGKASGPCSLNYAAMGTRLRRRPRKFANNRDDILVFLKGGRGGKPGRPGRYQKSHLSFCRDLTCLLHTAIWFGATARQGDKSSHPANSPIVFHEPEQARPLQRGRPTPRWSLQNEIRSRVSCLQAALDFRKRSLIWNGPTEQRNLRFAKGEKERVRKKV